MVYFARVGLDGPIKIGKTVHLPRRLEEHGDGYGAPLMMLGVMDGGLETEKEIRRRFTRLRIHTNSREGSLELFSPEQELLDYIAKHSRKPDLLDGIHENGNTSLKTKVIQVSRVYKNWLKAFAKSERMTVAQLMDVALVTYARQRGFEDAPDRVP